MPADPTQRERIRDDLREFVRGDLHFDEVGRGLYSSDASIFEIEPIGAIAPRDAADLQSIVKYCFEHRIPVVPRGAGTGMAGESLGDGLILDLSRYFRDVLEVGRDVVRVQPGVVLNRLNAELAKIGRRFAPDPASAATCTIGGMIANDASGARSLKYGYTRDHVLRLGVIFDNGEMADIGREPIIAAEPPSRLTDIVLATSALLRQHEPTIRASRPATAFNRCGYRLDGVLNDQGLDLPRLLTGSEGTLALITEATLRTVALPDGRALVLLGFASLDDALRAVRLIVPAGPSGCELLDRRLLSLARAAVIESARLLPIAAECALLVEFEADRPSEARRLAESAIRLIADRRVLASHIATDPEQMAMFWRLRDTAMPNLYGMGRGPTPVAIVEDIGVPPENLGGFLTQAQDLLQRHELTASFLTHAATGQVHIRPFIDLRDATQTERLWPLAEALYELTFEMGGTISTQHGTGIARTPWVPRQYSKLYPVFVALKSIFDPQELLNPGKIVSAVLNRPLWPIRPPAILPKPDPPASVPLALRWTSDAIETQVQACNGCGSCRTESEPTRMCPIFRVTHGESATPRSKANLLRRVWQNGDLKRLSDDDVRAVADLCVNCKMCASECPAKVDIPKLMLEAKAAHHAEHGLDRADWFLSRIELFAALGSRLSLLVNPLLNSRSARWVLERLFGVSRHRRLPAFASRSFLRLARRRKLTHKPADGDKIAYFVDVFANYNDPQIAEATVAVLRHHALNVYVPPGQWSCGMASLAMGDVETARELAQANLRVLGELARDGYRIICSEPTAALMLSHDYLDLMDDPTARLVAEQTVELTAFLDELRVQGRLRTDFQPLNISIGYHVPCHLKALGKPPASARLLAMIPGCHVHTIDVGCSGMAGTFGLKRRNYWTSLEAGRPMLEELRRPRVLFGAAECSSCRMQMEEGSGKRALHPVQYLAFAYGLMPEIEQRMRAPLNDRMLP